MQTSYSQQHVVAPQPGVVKGCSSRTTSRKMGGAVAQRDTTTVDTAVNDTAYSIGLAWTNPETGESKTATIGATSDSSATLEEIRDALVAAGNADADATTHVRFSADPDNADQLFITARRPGDSFSTTAGANLSNSTTRSSSTGNTLGFGRLAVGVEGKSNECDAPRSANATAKVMTWTPVAENAGVYYLQIRGDFDNDGIEEEYTFLYVGDGSATVQEIVEGIIAATPDKALPANSVTLSEDDTKVLVTGAIPGIDFQVNGWLIGPGAAEPSTAAVAVATTTARIPLRPLGVTIHKHTEQDANGDAYYRAGEMVNLHRAGDPILVELDSGVTPSMGDPVWARASASGTEVLGAFRTDQDGADCMPLPGMQFSWDGGGVVTTLGGKRAAYLRVNLP